MHFLCFLGNIGLTMMFLVYIDVPMGMLGVGIFGGGGGEAELTCWAYVPSSTHAEVLKAGLAFGVLVVIARCLTREVGFGVCVTEVSTQDYSEGQLNVSRVSTICTTTSFNPNQHASTLNKIQCANVEQATPRKQEYSRKSWMDDCTM
jgi:hypothetical protein